MPRLKSLPNTELSEYALKLLHRQQIFTVQEFMQHNNDKLSHFLNINNAQVEIIRQKLYLLHGPMVKNMYDVVNRHQNFLAALPSGCGCGIQALDQLLQNESLQPGSVWEICGRSGVGKSQFCFSIALNFIVKQQEALHTFHNNFAEMKEVLYIDTKLDFNAHRIVSMLHARTQLPKKFHGYVLQNIKVEHCYTLHSVKMTLEKVLQSFISRNEDYQNTRNIGLIIIDSLSAPWFHYRLEDDQTVVSHWLLFRINHLTHQLADQYGLAVIFVNLALQTNSRLRAVNSSQTKSVTTRYAHDDTDLNESSSQRSQFSSTVLYSDGFGNLLRPCLGRYWISVPNLRLLLNYVQFENDLFSQERKNSPLRNIIVLKSSSLAAGVQCQVQLTDQGVI